MPHSAPANKGTSPLRHDRPLVLPQRHGPDPDVQEEAGAGNLPHIKCGSLARLRCAARAGVDALAPQRADQAAGRLGQEQAAVRHHSRHPVANRRPKRVDRRLVGLGGCSNH